MEIDTDFVLEKPFTPRRSSKQIKSSFDNPAEKFSVKLWKEICWMSEKTETITVFQKIFGNFLWTRWLQFRQPCRVFSLKIGEQKKQKYFFHKNWISLVMFTWTCKIQLWQPCWENSIRSSKKNLHNFLKGSKKARFGKLFWQNFFLDT